MIGNAKIEQIMDPPHSRQNFSRIYTKLQLAELQMEIPDFDFSLYLNSLLPRELNATEHVVIYALSYFKQLTALLRDYDQR